MRPEYTATLIAAGLALMGYAIRAVYALTKEMTEWRVELFGPNGLRSRVDDHERRIRVLETGDVS